MQGALAQVLKQVKQPLAQFFAAQIRKVKTAGVSKLSNDKLGKLVESGLAMLIDEVANPAGVKKLLRDPLKFFGVLGEKLLTENRSRLVSLITGGSSVLAKPVGEAIDRLVKVVKNGGIKGLTAVSEAVTRLLATAALDKAVLRGVAEPKVRAILAKGIGWVVGEVSKLASGKGSFRSGGFDVGRALGEALRHVKKPIADYVAAQLEQRGLKAAAKRANAELRKLIAGGVSGVIDRLAQAAGVKRLLANPGGFLTELGTRLLRDYRDKIVAVVTGGDAMLRKVVEGAIDGLTTVVKNKGLPGLVSTNGVIAHLVRVFQGMVLSKIPDPVRGVVRKAFDAVAPKLRTEKGRSWLAKQGPAALFKGVSGYLRNLLEKVETVVKTQVAKARTQILQTLLALERTEIDPVEVAGQLTALASTLQGVRLPNLSFSL